MTVYIKCLDDPSISVILNNIDSVCLGDIDGPLCIQTHEYNFHFEYRLSFDIEECFKVMDRFILQDKIVLECLSSQITVSSGKY